VVTLPAGFNQFVDLRRRRSIYSRGKDVQAQPRESEEGMMTVISKDGTSIAYERRGSGPALIVVDGALCRRTFGPSAKLAAALSGAFTVYVYDRRGRGQSSDTSPYSIAREVDDLDALIAAAGGSAAVLGLSSGAALALEAAAAGSRISHVLAYEPPYVHEADAGERSGDHESNLKRLLAAGRRGAAVTYFMRDMVGAPGAMVLLMRVMPWIWRKLEAVAPTLPYDAAIMSGFRIPRTRFASIGIPALVMSGSKTDARLKAAARAVASAIPRAQHRELAGQTHNVNPGVLAAAAADGLAASGLSLPAVS
jgi:pimeloyl-ACP methyl ester carboxylesterase